MAIFLCIPFSTRLSSHHKRRIHVLIRRIQVIFAYLELFRTVKWTRKVYETKLINLENISYVEEHPIPTSLSLALLFTKPVDIFGSEN